MRKGELGLERAYKLEELRDRYRNLLEGLDNFNAGLVAYGYNKKLGQPLKVIKLIDKIFDSFPACEFLDKDSYVVFLNELKRLDALSDTMTEACRIIGSDFCSFSLCEFIWLGGELLELATYDNLICPDYPCTSEILCNDKFSYYEVDNDENEIVVDSPEKCWDYLKANYDALED